MNSQKLSCRIQIRFTPEENKQLRDLAKKHDRKTGNFLRLELKKYVLAPENNKKEDRNG